MTKVGAKLKTDFEMSNELFSADSELVYQLTVKLIVSAWTSKQRQVKYQYMLTDIYCIMSVLIELSNSLIHIHIDGLLNICNVITF